MTQAEISAMKNRSNFRQLQIFQEVVRTGSITKAARRLELTQPAVSSAIANLEHDLGFVLFRRNHYGTELTPEARYLAEGVEKVLAAVRNLDELANDLKQGRAGKLQIGCLPGFSTTIMPTIIARFMKANPGVKSQLQSQESGRIEEWVAAGHYDIGLVELPTTPSALQVESYRFEMLCAVHQDSTLASQESLSVQDLDGEPLITLNEQHQSTRQLQELFGKARCHLNVVAEAQIFPAALGMVAEGLGAALIDPVTAMDLQRQSNSPVVLKRFTPSVWFEVAVILPQHLRISKQCQQFHKLLLSELEQLELQLRETVNG